MNLFLIIVGIIILILMFLTLYRGIVGPTAIDRIMALNVIGTKTTILMVIIGTIYHRVDMFVDIAVAYAMLNFIATLAAARYFNAHKNLVSGGWDSTTVDPEFPESSDD